MAAFFWIHAGANNNWATNGNWSATSGGGSNAAQPSVTSDVTFDGAGANGNDASTVSAIQSVLSLTFTTGYTNTVTVNAALTIAGNFTDRTQHSWAGASAMTISATSTITSNGKTWPNAVTFTGANTKTLSGDWTISGALSCTSGTVTINKTTAETLNCAGLTVSTTTIGTIKITLTGGTWSGASANTLTEINFAGNVTVSGSVLFNTGTLTYTSGTITTTGSTLTVSATSTLNTNPISWNNVTLSGTSTMTLNSLFIVGGTVTVSSAITFAGTSGFSVANYLNAATSVANTVTLVHAVTYTITTSFSSFQTRVGANSLFTSDDGSVKAILTLNNGATCNVISGFTRIDASNGRAIWTFNGTVTTCINIFSLTDLSFVTGVYKVIQAGGNY